MSAPKETTIGMPPEEVRQHIATIRRAAVNLYSYIDMVGRDIGVDMLPHTNLVDAADALALLEGALPGTL
jgi:hypothetical protein